MFCGAGRNARQTPFASLHEGPPSHAYNHALPGSARTFVIDALGDGSSPLSLFLRISCRSGTPV
jgi:hypothetical protein